MTAGAEQIPRRQFWLDAAIVFLIACCVMSPVLGGGYSPLDDYSMLRDNPRYHDPSWDNFRAHWNDPDFRIFAPLTYSIWHVLAAAVDVKTTPLPFKVLSVLTHGFASVAGWWALRLMLRRRWIAILGAMLIAAHPVQVEAVAWTTGFKDLLCAGLMFASIGAYVRHLDTRKRRLWRASLVLAILAMLAKPTAMMLPFMLLATEWWRSEKLDCRLALRRLWPFFIPAAVVGLIMLRVQGDANVPYVAPLVRPLIALDALAFYLWKIILPINLVPDYTRTTTAVMRSGQLAWTWIAPVVLMLAIARFGSRRLKLAGLLMVIPLLPVLGLVPFDMQQYSTVADHYLYPSMLGVGLALFSWRRTDAPRRVWVETSILAVLAVATFVQASRWRDIASMLERTTRISPRSAVTYGNLANLAIDRRDWEAAERYARKSVELERRPIALSNLSVILYQRGQLEESTRYAREAFDLGLADPWAVQTILKQAKASGDKALEERAQAMLRRLDEMRRGQSIRLLPVDK